MSDTRRTDAIKAKHTYSDGFGTSWFHVGAARDFAELAETLESELAALREENERLRKDAERYRFILLSSSGLDVFVAAYHNTNLINEIDAAIDAAIAARAAS